VALWLLLDSKIVSQLSPYYRVLRLIGKMTNGAACTAKPPTKSLARISNSAKVLTSQVGLISV